MLYVILAIVAIVYIIIGLKWCIGDEFGSGIGNAVFVWETIGEGIWGIILRVITFPALLIAIILSVIGFIYISIVDIILFTCGVVPILMFLVIVAIIVIVILGFI